MNLLLRRRLIVVVPVVLVGILTVVLLGSLGLFDKWVNDLFPPKTPPGHILTEQEVKEVIKKANQHMPNISVTSLNDPIIRQSEDDKAITFLVESKLEKEYKFNSTEYQLLQYVGDMKKIDLNNMALEIDKIYSLDDNTSFSKLTGTVTFSGGVPPYASGTLAVSGPIRDILEMLGLIRTLSNLDVDHIDIAIKGYADGEKTKDWHSATPIVDPECQTFDVLQPETKYFLFYTKRAEKHKFSQLGGHYDNYDLPDLRAQFVRIAFVQPFVEGCTRNKDRCHVYVLHNEPIPDKKRSASDKKRIPVMDEEMRKVQVYLMVYLKKQVK